MTLILTNGFGGTAPYDPLAAAKPIYAKDDVWFVSSLVGSDSDCTGLDRESPYATLSNAAGNCSDGDTIVLMSGHAETVKDLTIPDGVTIAGEGISGGKPTVTLTPHASSSAYGMKLGECCELRNVLFAPPASPLVKPVVRVAAPGVHIVGCYFRCGPNQSLSALELTSYTPPCGGTTTYAHYTHVEDTTFVSEGTSLTALPASGIVVAAALDGLRFENVVIDDGVYGFGQTYAYFAGALACKFSRHLGISHLRGAAAWNHPNTTGYYNPQTNTGGGTVNW